MCVTCMMMDVYSSFVICMVLFFRVLKIDKESLVSRSPASHRKGLPNGKLTFVSVSKPHTQPVTAIAFDPDGKLLATGVSLIKKRIIL